MAVSRDRRSRLHSASPSSSRVPPELRLLHGWLDTWRGIGDTVNGMHRAGWDLQASGLQSLVSVYLLALCVPTYFGKPVD
jgi:hypothetical protein